MNFSTNRFRDSVGCSTSGFCVSFNNNEHLGVTLPDAGECRIELSSSRNATRRISRPEVCRASYTERPVASSQRLIQAHSFKAVHAELRGEFAVCQ